VAPKEGGRLRLDRKDRKILRRCVASYLAPAAHVRRARLVLLLDEGVSGREVARRLGTPRSQVAKWLGRYLTGGLEALRDAPRSGRPRRIRQGERVETLAVACRSPMQLGVERTLWSQKSLAQFLTASGRVRQISASSVQRILAEADLRPHKVRMWCTSNDPDYDRKKADVLSLYLDPPPGEAVVCIDEKTQIQALSRRVPLRRAREGLEGCQEHDYKRHGTRCLFACFDVRTGQVLGRMGARRRQVEYLAFLDEVARTYPRGRVHVIQDNLNTHAGDPVDTWNRRHGGRFAFHFTPYYASWLNQVEIFFSILTRRVLRYGEFADTALLDRAVVGFLNEWNREEAHPFEWTYDGRRVEGRARLVA
jgi:transposase